MINDQATHEMRGPICAARNRAIFIVLVLAFFLRIYKVNSPLIGMSSWRQADTAALARNYFESGYHFLYPRVDWGGDSAGYVETEFPLYSFLVAILYKAFGPSVLLGRLLSILFSLLTIYGLYLLVLKWLDQKTALWACVFYAILPPCIFYSRTFQPESALLMSLVLGVYFFSHWMDTKKTRFFFLSFVFVALACLLKIPSLYIGLPLLYMAWQKYESKVFFQKSLWFYALCVFVPVAFWYFHARQIYKKYGLTFGVWAYGKDKWGNWDLVLTWKYWNRILFQNLAEDYLTWAGFVILVIGLLLKRRTDREKALDFWLISIFIYFIIVAGGNFAHLYYQLPFMLPASVFIAKVYSRYWTRDILRNKRSTLLAAGLAIVFLLSAGRYSIYLQKENTRNSPVLKIAEEIRRWVRNDELVIVVDNGDPTILYLSHRKGWKARAEEVNSSYIMDKKVRGARYLVGNLRAFNGEEGQNILASLLSSEVCLYDDKKFIILRLFEEDNRGND